MNDLYSYIQTNDPFEQALDLVPYFGEYSLRELANEVSANGMAMGVVAVPDDFIPDLEKKIAERGYSIRDGIVYPK